MWSYLRYAASNDGFIAPRHEQHAGPYLRMSYLQSLRPTETDAKTLIANGFSRRSPRNCQWGDVELNRLLILRMRGLHWPMRG